MTFAQIEKTKIFLDRIDSVRGFYEMGSFVGELEAYYGLPFLNIDLVVRNGLATQSSYSEWLEAKDKKAIRNYLEGRIDENDANKTILEILELIDEGEISIQRNSNMISFIKKAYYSYQGSIPFDKMTEAVATAPDGFFKSGTVKVDENMVRGAITKLRIYGASLLEKQALERKKATPQVVVNNTNNASASATTSIDIAIVLKQARQQIEDSGLGEQQYKDTMAKLSEIESIDKSDEPKGKKWTRVKEIIKWCTEQGIEIAKIVMPLLLLILGQ